VIATAPGTKKIWTEAELAALPDDGFVYEVVEGELVLSPKNNFQHENICAALLTAMRTFAKTNRLGAVLGSSAGFWMRDRNCRAPDISFITKARLISLGFKPSTQKFFPGAPDLAIEVLAPSNTRAEIDERLSDFFASGAQIAWIINPDDQCVEVCYSASKRKLLGRAADLDGEHLLPGFRYRIADLFREWDWE